jgi:putative PIN family toxin of toxin-antitoxin system
MPTDQRFVLDTNTIVSALLLRRSVSRQAFDTALAAGTLAVSLPVIEELNDVLKRPGFERYVREQERLEFLSALLREALLVEVTETVRECRDPNDDKFLELALSADAMCVVTGDHDLLVLHPFRGIPILTPRSFLDHRWLR